MNERGVEKEEKVGKGKDNIGVLASVLGEVPGQSDLPKCSVLEPGN